MNNFDFQRLQDLLLDWSSKNFPDALSYQPLLGAIEELGELAHAHLKQEQNIRMNENHYAQKVDAIGDVIIYLAHYCSLNKINLQEAVFNTWEEVSKRDWRK